MVFYSEEKVGRRSIFTATFKDESGEIIQQRTATCPLYQSKEDGFTYFVLYDDNMVPMSDVFDFLNCHLRGNPLTTRTRKAYALRLLYCFLSMSDLSIADMNAAEFFSQFVYFVRGISIGPNEYSSLTVRNNATVNGYFATYREYFEFLGEECKPLFSSSEVVKPISFGSEISHTKVGKYKQNLKVNSNTDRYVPKYISPDEFTAIIDVVRDAKDIQAEMMIYLMYGSGLRLGEVLGLTLEDIDTIEIDDVPIPVLRLRNRLSDKKFQFAKLQPHVIDKREYSSTSYRKATSEIVITRDMYGKLLDYIGATFDRILVKNPKYLDRAVADLVSCDTDLENNYYLFLNSYGKPLSDQVWNKRLREYFKKSGISVDTNKKENNLSHRFRHGFAMLHTLYSPKPLGHLELQKLMRHRSLASTMVYYNPTPNDELKIKTSFEESSLKNIKWISSQENKNE